METSGKAMQSETHSFDKICMFSPPTVDASVKGLYPWYEGHQHSLM